MFEEQLNFVLQAADDVIPALKPEHAIEKRKARNLMEDVDTIFVDGHAVVESGRVLNADEGQLRAAAPDILKSMLNAASERDPMGRTAESILGLA